ncbi:MAG: RluA family pseudouridine synthase [Butyrivibrio sp.]|nr:RluA family pseudouridine synthase [Butyrivibrio sp.]
MTGNIKYIYEDQDILVCHKPAGMATEGAGAGRMDLISAARNYLARKNRGKDTGRQRNLPPYVATVNRLDKPVEGIIVLAKNKKAAGSLASQIKEHKTDKYYYALCCGRVEPDSGKLEDILIRRQDTGLAGVISKEEAESFKDEAITLKDGTTLRTVGGEPRRATLEYEVISRPEDATLLRVHLLTGRFHQIRCQLSSAGYPILGDKEYETPESAACSAKHNIDRVCLVSYSFSFKHPGTGKTQTFEIIPDNPAIRQFLPAQA